MLIRMTLAPDGEQSALLCPPLVATLLAALDYLLQATGDGDEPVARPGHSRSKSGTMSSIGSLAMSPATRST